MILAGVALLAALGLVAFYLYLQKEAAQTPVDQTPVTTVPVNSGSQQNAASSGSQSGATTAEQDLSGDVLSGTEYNLRAGLSQ